MTTLPYPSPGHTPSFGASGCQAPAPKAALQQVSLCHHRDAPDQQNIETEFSTI